MRLFLPLLSLVVLQLLAPSAGAQQLWQFAPYHIQVWLAPSPSLEFEDSLITEIQQTIEDRSWSVVGAAWMVDVSFAPPASYRQASVSLDLPSYEDAIADAPDLNDTHDKVIFVRLDRSPSGYVVEARELDCLTRVLGRIVERRVPTVAQIPDAAFSAVHDAFRTLGRIERVNKRDVRLILQAGGLVLESPRLRNTSPAGMAPGDVLQPVIRTNDADGEPREEGGIEVIPWSFLAIEENSRGVLECELQAGIRSAIGGRISRRIQKVALGVNVADTPTALKLYSRRDRDEPLAGYDVYERPSFESKELNFIGRTDWRGLVNIPHGEKPVRLLYVKNGNNLLARLPMAPGLEDELVAHVPDDDARLEAEGFVQGIQSRVIDLLAQQQVLAARIRAKIKEKKLGEAEELLNQYRSLPTRADIQRRLDQKAKEQLAATDDKYVRARMDSMFTNTRKILSKFLSHNLGGQLASELQSAQTGG